MKPSYNVVSILPRYLTLNLIFRNVESMDQLLIRSISWRCNILNDLSSE